MEYEEARQILDSYNALSRALRLPPNVAGSVLTAKAAQVMADLEVATVRCAALEKELVKLR